MKNKLHGPCPGSLFHLAKLLLRLPRLGERKVARARGAPGAPGAPGGPGAHDARGARGAPGTRGARGHVLDGGGIRGDGAAVDINTAGGSRLHLARACHGRQVRKDLHVRSARKLRERVAFRFVVLGN